MSHLFEETLHHSHPFGGKLATVNHTNGILTYQVLAMCGGPLWFGQLNPGHGFHDFSCNVA